MREEDHSIQSMIAIAMKRMPVRAFRICWKVSNVWLMRWALLTALLIIKAMTATGRAAAIAKTIGMKMLMLLLIASGIIRPK